MKAFFRRLKDAVKRFWDKTVVFFGRFSKRTYATLAIILLAVILVVDVGYHLIKGLSSDLETVTAKRSCLEETVTADAYLVRDEKPLSESGGKYLYYVEDGEKVKVGTPLFAVYPTNTSTEVLSALGALLRAKAILAEADSTRPEKISESLKLKIEGVMLAVEEAVSRGDIEKANREREALSVLMFCREELEGALSLAEVMISLDREIGVAKLLAGEPVREVVSQEAGWFAYGADGYEGFASSVTVSDMDYDSLAALLNQREVAESASAGRMILSHGYNLVTFVSTEEAQSFGANKKYDLTYDGIKLTLTLDKMLYQSGKDEVALIFTGTSLSSALSLRRIADLSLTVETHEGFKIPTAALVENGGVYGVYILKGFVVEFREVSVIYRVGNTVILDNAPADSSGKYKLLAENDNVIIKGEELYDGKITA